MVCENPLKEEFYTHRDPNLDNCGPAGQHTKHFIPANIIVVKQNYLDLYSIPISNSQTYLISVGYMERQYQMRTVLIDVLDSASASKLVSS